MRRLDAGALEVALIGQRDAFLVAGRDQDFEGEGRLCRAVAQHRAVEVVTGLGQQRERARAGRRGRGPMPSVTGRR